MDSYTNHLRHGHNYLRRNHEVIEPEGHATDLFSDWAAAYLQERAQLHDQPFFLFLAYNAPHFPIEPPADWLDRVRQRAPSSGRQTGLERRLRRTPRPRHRPRSGSTCKRPASTGTRWWCSPPTTAVRCRTPKTTIRGATASKATTTAACGCPSSPAGPTASRPGHRATMPA
jgi:hypothetical protein